MDIKTILKQSLEINIQYKKEKSEENFHATTFKTRMEEEYPFFVIAHSAIFNISMSPSYDFLRLKKMLILADKVKTSELSEHDASVQVGQILVDEVVKPQLNK